MDLDRSLIVLYNSMLPSLITQHTDVVFVCYYLVIIDNYLLIMNYN